MSFSKTQSVEELKIMRYSIHRYLPINRWKKKLAQRKRLILSKTTEPLSTTEKQRLLTMMKAIGHPMRFEILQFLMLNPNCYTKDIVEHLPISQATVSQHIKQLREAGWLSSEAVCQMTSHWLDLANIEWFKQTVGEMF